MVVADALKERFNFGRDPSLYFWRDTNGNEIDFLWDRQGFGFDGDQIGNDLEQGIPEGIGARQIRLLA